MIYKIIIAIILIVSLCGAYILTTMDNAPQQNSTTIRQAPSKNESALKDLKLN